MIRRILILIFFFLASFVCDIEADTIHLRNGRSIEGLIKKERGESVWLDIGFGTVKFRKEEIERIERSSPDEVSRIRKEWQRQRKLEEERWLKRERELEEARRRKEFEPKEVKFSRDTEQIVVNALLNGKTKASLLLDTGASTILLSSRIAEELGLESQVRRGKMVEMKMADGRMVDARYVVLDSVDVEGAVARDVGAVVLVDSSQMDIHDGLLGMSFLNRFNFQIDTVNKKLILKKRK